MFERKVAHTEAIKKAIDLSWYYCVVFIFNYASGKTGKIHSQQTQAA